MEKLKFNTEKTTPSWKHIIQSVLGAFIGIQNKNHAEKDFKQGNIYVYGFAGIVGVIILIAIIIGVVNWVLTS